MNYLDKFILKSFNTDDLFWEREIFCRFGKRFIHCVSLMGGVKKGEDKILIIFLSNCRQFRFSRGIGRVKSGFIDIWFRSKLC